MSADITSNRLWTRSETSHVLTRYAEGLSIAEYDAHDDYICCYRGNYEWWICRKDHLSYSRESVISLPESNIGPHHCHESSQSCSVYPTYVHLRKVNIVNGWMTCSCMEYIQKLRPCRHMGAVLFSLGVQFAAQHYHIRWWMIMCYDDQKSAGLKESVALALQNTRQMCFENGLFKGIYVGKILSQPMSSIVDDHLLIMQSIDTCIKKKGLLVLNSKEHIRCVEGAGEEDDYDEKFCFDFDLGMGGTSEGQVSLSTTAIEDTFNNSSENVMSREQIWSRLYSKFKHIASLVENEDECSKVEDQLDTIIYSSTKTEVRMSEDVFGTTDHSGRKERRVKARYENR